MSSEIHAEIAFMERVTHLGMDLAKQESLESITPDHKEFLRHLLSTGWLVQMHRPYRWEITAPFGDVMTFDEKHNALNISKKRA